MKPEITRRLRSSPIVSVVIPVRNGGELLKRAVGSVIKQTLQDFEIIVVDDGSTDNTSGTIAALSASDSRVRGLRNSPSLRAPGASNRGISSARGRWIAILDHDDWYGPDRLQSLIQAGEEEGADLVADNQYFVDAQAGAIFRTAVPIKQGRESLSLRTLLSNALTGQPEFDYGMLKPIFRADFLNCTGVRYIEECYEGYDFHILLDTFANGGSVCLVNWPYYFYTVPFGPLSRRPASETKQVYDYSRMRMFAERALQQYREMLSPSELALLEERIHSIDAYSKYLATKSALANHCWSSAWKTLIDYRVLSFAWRALRRRLISGHHLSTDVNYPIGVTSGDIQKLSNTKGDSSFSL